MKTWITAGSALVALMSGAALAAPPKIELVTPRAKVGAASLAVKVSQDGKPVSGATVTAKRLDMSPDSMGEMAMPVSKAQALPGGVYRFSTNLPMAGHYALTVAALAPGTRTPVTATFEVAAQP
jgi:hypothetical protein